MRSALPRGASSSRLSAGLSLTPGFVPSYPSSVSATSVRDRAASTRRAADLCIQQVKAFRRCIDYPKTRREIDSQRTGYDGMSRGGENGTLVPAVEPRVKASMLLAGFLSGLGRPAAHAVSRATTSPCCRYPPVSAPFGPCW